MKHITPERLQILIELAKNGRVNQRLPNGWLLDDADGQFHPITEEDGIYLRSAALIKRDYICEEFVEYVITDEGHRILASVGSEVA